jgi:hypothetical protein
MGAARLSKRGNLVAAQVKLSVLTFFVLVAADVNTPGVSHIEEVTQSDSPEADLANGHF